MTNEPNKPKTNGEQVEATAAGQTLPSVTAGTALAAITTESEFRTQTNLILRQATDLVNQPIVQQGYALKGLAPNLAYVHLDTMAYTRLKKIFPVMNKRDLLFSRLMAEAKLIVAEHIVRKYESRLAGIDYDYKKDLDFKIPLMVREKRQAYENTIKKLEAK